MSGPRGAAAEAVVAAGTSPERTAMIEAYGILWRCPIADKSLHRARHAPRDQLTPDERQSGVKMAIETYGPSPKPDDVI